MRIIHATITISLLGCIALLGAAFFVVHHKCIDLTQLERYQSGKPSILLDDQGNEWARFQLDRREPIALQTMPEHLIHAFLAAEDWSFFHHAGISWKGIIRSTLVNLYHGRKVQGASTITQQLVRLLFFDAKKTFTRKIKEQLLALLVECQFSKEQILETYLNHVYFGCGIYGVQAACQRFWGTDAADISIDQAAVLAAIMRSPNHYCPLLNPQAACTRRNLILHSMYKLNFITKSEYHEAKNQPCAVVQSHDQCAPHLKEMIRIYLEELIGKQRLYTDGLTIQTTLNRHAQDAAQKSFTDHCATLRATLMPQADGGLICVAVATGQIKALVGGFDFATSQFNRAVQARRQMGSIFKPLIYTVALQHGKRFTDIELDVPLQLVQSNGTMWEPHNATLQFQGPMTLAWGLSTSNNIIAIKTLLKVGIQSVIDLATKCHIKGPCVPYPSLALGCVDVTLQEAAGMFNIFANHGIYVEPHAVMWVKDSHGKKIWRSMPEHERVIDVTTCGQVAKVLELGLQRVKAQDPEQPWIESQAISKTGTTNDSRTCWFVGATPELTTAIYIGSDDNSPLGHNVFPIRTAFPIWLNLYRQLPVQTKKFVHDPQLHEVTVHERTGSRVSPHTSGAITIFDTSA